MKTSIEQIKNIFTSNFATLKPTLFDMNVATLKVNASFEYEGEFTDPELIVNVYDNVINEEEVSNMIQMFEDDMFEEVTFKCEKDDYIISAGCPEVVYSMKLQILRIK